MMKNLPLSFLLSLVVILLRIGGIESVDVPPPDGALCWSSTFAIFQNELGSALNPTVDLSEERRYIFCTDTVYPIARVNPPEALPDPALGEQWPLLLTTPNVHLVCPIPHTCILEMVEPANVLFGAITQIAASSGLVPAGLTAPPSRTDNLVFDGFLIRNKDKAIFPDTFGVITLGAPGLGMKIQNCVFDSTLGIGGWAISSEYYASEAELQGISDGPYQSLTVENCTFTDGSYDRAAIVAFEVDDPLASGNETFPSSMITLKDLYFTGNSNSGVGGTGGFKALITTEDFVSVTAENLCFVDNETPTGSVMDLQGPETTLGNIYASGTASSGEEDCVDGIIEGGECTEGITIDSCPLDEDDTSTSEEPSGSPSVVSEADTSEGPSASPSVVSEAESMSPTEESSSPQGLRLALFGLSPCTLFFMVSILNW